MGPKDVFRTCLEAGCAEQGHPSRNNLSQCPDVNQAYSLMKWVLTHLYEIYRLSFCGITDIDCQQDLVLRYWAVFDLRS